MLLKVKGGFTGLGSSRPPVRILNVDYKWIAVLENGLGRVRGHYNALSYRIQHSQQELEGGRGNRRLEIKMGEEKGSQSNGRERVTMVPSHAFSTFMAAVLYLLSASLQDTDISIPQSPHHHAW